MDDGKDVNNNNQQDLGSSSVLSNPNLPVHDSVYSRMNNECIADDDEEIEEDEVEDEELGEGDVGVLNVAKMITKDDDNGGENDDVDGENDVDDEDETDDDEDVDEGNEGKVPRKKRKLQSLISNYEFAPRAPPQTPALAPARAPSSGRRNSGADWTERETAVLVDAWGERFLQRGRKSLPMEEWRRVSDRVSQETGIQRTDTQCRNRLDTLKKKYRREKTKLQLAQMQAQAKAAEGNSNWPFYTKMDLMLNPPPAHPQQLRSRLSCGVDSGEYVFTGPKAFSERPNGSDRMMKDSPGNSKDDDDDDDGGGGGVSDRLRVMNGNRRSVDGCFRLLADSIQKFSDIYEKIEVSKRKQMVELENMRMDFHRQLETQRRQILERAHAEIAKIRQADDHD